MQPESPQVLNTFSARKIHLIIQPNLSISFLNFLNFLNLLLPLSSDVKEMVIRVHCRARVYTHHRFGLVSLYYVLCFCVVLTVLCCAIKRYMPCHAHLLRYFFIVYVLGYRQLLLAHGRMAVSLFLLPLPCCLLCLYGSGNALPLRVLRWLFVTIMN